MSSGLQHEIKQTRPFQSAEEEALLNLLRTSDQIQNRIGRLLREFGLTSSQYNVLRILRGAKKPLPCLEVASRMVQVVPAITGLTDRLEKQGFVKRTRSKEDRRVVYIELTENAAKLLSKIDGPIAKMHEVVIGHLTNKELKELSRLLEKARKAEDDYNTKS